MKALFLLNPAAGHGRTESRWRQVAARLPKERPGDVVRTTCGPGDAARLAREGLEEGFAAIIAVGGDGTLGEVVDGYLSAPAELRTTAALGTWPVGSGCDFARHWGIKPNAETLLAALATPTIRRLDAGKVTYTDAGGKGRTRHFLNMAAFGLAGDVAMRAQAHGKLWGGTLSYMFDSLAALLMARPKTMDLVIDGERLPRAGFHLVTLANTSTFGGGMHIAPDADAEDGFLDLVTVADLPRLKLLRRFPSIYSGNHLGTEGVECRRVRRVEASSQEVVHLNVDGDIVGTLPAVFEVLPKAVSFLLPA